MDPQITGQNGSDSRSLSLPELPAACQDIAVMEQMLNCMPVGAMLVDPRGHIECVNQYLLDTLLYDKEELLHQSTDHLLPPQYQEGHAALVAGYFNKPRQRQMGAGRNLSARRKDGSTIPIEVGLNPLMVGSERWVLATLVDITPRVQASRMFRQSVSVAPHGVLVIGRDGLIQLVNKYLCSCFGYSEDELIGKPVEMLLPDRYRNGHEFLRNGFMANPSVRVMGPGRDLTALHKDGWEFPVEIGLSPFDDEHQSGLVMVSLLDITERKRTELELRETNTNLEEFTYVASHDLRSPLRGISDLLQWIQEDLGEDVQEEVAYNLERIAVRINRVEQLIDNLLTYARAGRRDSDCQTISLSEILADVIELIEIPEGFVLEQDLQLDTLVASKIPLETVLRNIISNALKHHDREDGVIKVTSAADNNLCHITISDDGPGIPDSAKDRIFRLFQTVSAVERQGSGIGLSVSRRLVETHGGKISVETNQHQRGLTFHVWWPRFARKGIND